MIKTLLFLTAVGLSQAAQRGLTAPHPDCPEKGHHLLPHEYDCTKFYYCERGERFIEPTSCPPGTGFSAYKQVCAHSSLSNCALPGAPSDRPTGTPTASPTTAAPTATPTTAASTAAPTAAPTATPTTSASTAAPTAAPTATPSVAPPAEEDSCEYLDNGCPADYNIEKLLPHDTSCRGYYQCVHGEKVLRRCARGTAFNPKTQRCDHANQVDRTCEDDESPEVSSEESEESVEYELLPNGCPANWGISKYLPHEYYCNLYYQCSYGNRIERHCPAGTQFSYELQICQHSHLVNCNLPGGDAVITTTTTVRPTSTTIGPFDVLDNGCPVDGSINWLLPHEDDCNKFYFCVWGNLVLSHCPSTLHFNPKTQNCDSPANAGCACSTCSNCGNDDSSGDCSGENNSGGDENSSEIDNNSSGGDDNNSSGDNNSNSGNNNSSSGDNNSSSGDKNNSEVDDNNCSGNKHCVDESSEEDVLPGGDDGNVSVPEPDSESKEVKDNKCEEECNVLPWAHEDCDKYWICDGKRPSLVVCAEGLHFNPATNTCDFACNAGCIRETVQATAGPEGLKLFLPWDKIDDETRTLINLIAH